MIKGLSPSNKAVTSVASISIIILVLLILSSIAITIVIEQSNSNTEPIVSEVEFEKTEYGVKILPIEVNSKIRIYYNNTLIKIISKDEKGDSYYVPYIKNRMTLYAVAGEPNNRQVIKERTITNPNEPVAFYTFNNSEDEDTITDYSKNENDAIINGDVEWISNKNGSSVLFKKNSYAIVDTLKSSGDGINLKNTTIVIRFEANSNGKNNQKLLSISSSDSYQRIRITKDSGDFEPKFLVSKIGSFRKVIGSKQEINQPTALSTTYDKSNIMLFQPNDNISTSSFSSTLVEPRLTIGSFQDSIDDKTFTGKIHTVIIYNKTIPEKYSKQYSKVLGETDE